MFGGFSSGLKLTDLNDFITPSQECIKPVQTATEKSVTSTKGLIQIEDDDSNAHKNYEKAKITLSDCLACSGCITSAEAVLVNQQSFEQLNRVLKENGIRAEDEKLTTVLSLSTQAVLSLSAKYNLSPQEGLQKISGFFKSIGVNYVFDVSFARCFSIIEAQKEFLGRYRKRNEDSSSLPMLTSACPGWICYAEKTHGSFILPYISQTRSPQQVMGVLVKDYFSRKLSIMPDKIYHATLMPCFDKKLEASREEFQVADLNTSHVDCVITPVEVQQMLENEDIDLRYVEEAGLDLELSLGHQLTTHEGSGSGGFAHHVFIYAAKNLFGVDEYQMNWKTVRNIDILEVTLEKNGETMLRFAIANGFRNIQNLVQKLKRNKNPYHFVEVMACPSGCLNGGAQISAASGTSSKELITLLDKMYKDLPKIPLNAEDQISHLYSEWIGTEDSDDAQKKLCTTYKKIEQSMNPLGIKW